MTHIVAACLVFPLYNQCEEILHHIDETCIGLTGIVIVKLTGLRCDGYVFAKISMATSINKSTREVGGIHDHYTYVMYLHFISIFSINIMEIVLLDQDFLVFLGIFCKSTGRHSSTKVAEIVFH